MYLYSHKAILKFGFLYIQAKAVADMNQRDIQTQQEQEERSVSSSSVPYEIFYALMGIFMGILRVMGLIVLYINICM